MACVQWQEPFKNTAATVMALRTTRSHWHPSLQASGQTVVIQTAPDARPVPRSALSGEATVPGPLAVQCISRVLSTGLVVYSPVHHGCRRPGDALDDGFHDAPRQHSQRHMAPHGADRHTGV